MTRQHDGPLADSTDNGGSTDAVPPVWRDDEGQSPQSLQQASSGDCVGQVREEVRQPSANVMRAMTDAALGGLGIGSGPQGVEIFASPVARKIINGADSVSGMEQAPSVWLGDIPSAE